MFFILSAQILSSRLPVKFVNLLPLNQYFLIVRVVKNPINHLVSIHTDELFIKHSYKKLNSQNSFEKTLKSTTKCRFFRQTEHTKND